MNLDILLELLGTDNLQDGDYLRIAKILHRDPDLRMRLMRAAVEGPTDLNDLLYTIASEFASGQYSRTLYIAGTPASMAALRDIKTPYKKHVASIVCDSGSRSGTTSDCILAGRICTVMGLPPVIYMDPETAALEILEATQPPYVPTTRPAPVPENAPIEEAGLVEEAPIEAPVAGVTSEPTIVEKVVSALDALGNTTVTLYGYPQMAKWADKIARSTKLANVSFYPVDQLITTDTPARTMYHFVCKKNIKTEHRRAWERNLPEGAIVKYVHGTSNTNMITAILEVAALLQSK